MTLDRKKYALLFLPLLLAACTSTPPAPPPKPVVPLGIDDDNAERMRQLSYAMLLCFYKLKGFPDTLPQFQPYAMADTHLEFTNPDTNAPYTYAPDGLTISQTDPRILFVYDSIPDRHGIRWGIIGTPATGTKPITLLAVPMDEKLFSSFHP